MLLKIDFQSDIPIYIQLKQQIIEGIASGEVSEGENLPSVRQMAEDIGINLHTVNKAYTILKNDNIILMDRRKGAVVNKKENMISDKSTDKLVDDIKPIAAEAYCKGFSEKEFINICSEIYKGFLREK